MPPKHSIYISDVYIYPCKILGVYYCFCELVSYRVAQHGENRKINREQRIKYSIASMFLSSLWK